MFALFIYNPMMNSTTFAGEGSDKHFLIDMAHKRFHDNLMFSIYKFRDDTHITKKRVPVTRWDLDTKFDGKNVAEYHKGFNQPMECAYCIDDEEVWFFKTF